MPGGIRLPVDEIARGKSQPSDLLSQGRSPNPANAGFNEFEKAVLRALGRRADFQSIPFVTTANALRLRPAEERVYFFIQNLDPVNRLLIGFDIPPTAAAANSVNMGPNGFYEPLIVPQNEIWILGSVVGTFGILLFASRFR